MQCLNGAVCNITTGTCACTEGWKGKQKYGGPEYTLQRDGNAATSSSSTAELLCCLLLCLSVSNTRHHGFANFHTF